MSILIQNVTAVLLDESRTVLPNAFVAVEGSQISPRGSLTGWWTAPER